MLQLQAIIERVAKTMGPVEKRQGDEREEVESRHGVLQKAVKGLVVGRLKQPQGKGQPSQEEMDGEQEGGDRPPRAEQEPEKRRDRSHHLTPKHNKGHGTGKKEPGRVV